MAAAIPRMRAIAAAAAFFEDTRMHGNSTRKRPPAPICLLPRARGRQARAHEDTRAPGPR